MTIPLEGIKPSVRIYFNIFFYFNKNFSRSLMVIEINVNFHVEKEIITKVKKLAKFSFNTKLFISLDKVVGFRYGK